MKGSRSFVLFLLIYTLAAIIILPADPLPAQGEDEVIIPSDAQQKAEAALQALGPTRGAVSIESRMVRILGVAKGIEARSEKLHSALKDLGAKESDTEILIELSGDILFDFDKWSIREDAEKSLSKVADIILAYNKPVHIIGHTDAKGAEGYNLSLSKKRAESVKQWLVEKGGIATTLIKTTGKGESEPAAANTLPDGSDSPEGRQKNRRVELKIRKK